MNAMMFVIVGVPTYRKWRTHAFVACVHYMSPPAPFIINAVQFMQIGFVRKIVPCILYILLHGARWRGWGGGGALWACTAHGTSIPRGRAHGLCVRHQTDRPAWSGRPFDVRSGAVVFNYFSVASNWWENVIRA